MCRQVVDKISSSLKLILKVDKKSESFCYGRFHDILPKEYFGTLLSFFGGR
jgi:hypothetical protein